MWVTVYCSIAPQGHSWLTSKVSTIWTKERGKERVEDNRFLFNNVTLKLPLVAVLASEA